jgi:hypothetical protein
MKVKTRFFKHMVWGSIALLLVIVMGCSNPSGSNSTNPDIDPTSQEKQKEKDSEKNSGEENQDEPKGENESGNENGNESENGNENGNGNNDIGNGEPFPEEAEFVSVASVDELKAYLADLPVNDETDPYPVKIGGIDLSSKDNLKTLYDAFGKDKYVALDLSGCTGTQFAAASTPLPAIANRKNIVFLILPDSITDILANGFSGYTALKSIMLPKVTTIDTSGFKDCSSLKTVSAPELKEIAEGASNSTGVFIKCIALKTLYCPNLVTLGKYAFYECSSLTEVTLPKVQDVGGMAFKRCTALKSASLPNAAKIGNDAFAETALENLALGVNPPELGTGVFAKEFSQSGVIYVPASAVDTYKNTDLANWSKLKSLVKPL